MLVEGKDSSTGSCNSTRELEPISLQERTHLLHTKMTAPNNKLPKVVTMLWILILVFVTSTSAFTTTPETGRRSQRLANIHNHAAIAMPPFTTLMAAATVEEEESSSSTSIEPSSSSPSFTTMPVFDFSSAAKNATNQFERIDDVIMGGISSSQLRQLPTESFARWSGICRLDGGYVICVECVQVKFPPFLFSFCLFDFFGIFFFRSLKWFLWHTNLALSRTLACRSSLCCRNNYKCHYCRYGIVCDMPTQ